MGSRNRETGAVSLEGTKRRKKREEMRMKEIVKTLMPITALWSRTLESSEGE